MIIGLNAQELLKPNPAGPEKYTYHLYNHLATIDHTNFYTLYFKKKPDKQYFSTLTQNNSNFRYKVIKSKISWTQVGLAKELAKNKVDVYFTPVHTMPIIHPKKLKIAGMVHGLEYTFSHEYKNVFKKLFINKPVKYVCIHSDKIITPSKAVKEDILSKWTKIKPEKIKVVYEGVSKNFGEASQAQIENIKEKYQINDAPYLFFISTIQPRKNIPRMVEGFSLALKNKLIDPGTKLIIAGKKGWDYEESLRSFRKYNVQHNTIYAGRIPDEDVAPLMKGASAFISVSLEEGFGLPVAEALSCGTPLILSDIPAFREVGGDIPYFADPNNVEDISQKIQKVINNPPETRKINERSKLFTWENTAQQTLDTFKNLVKNI